LAQQQTTTKNWRNNKDGKILAQMKEIWLCESQHIPKANLQWAPRKALEQ
jgi:hypothetical protein